MVFGVRVRARFNNRMGKNRETKQKTAPTASSRSFTTTIPDILICSRTRLRVWSNNKRTLSLLLLLLFGRVFFYFSLFLFFRFVELKKSIEIPVSPPWHAPPRPSQYPQYIMHTTPTYTSQPEYYRFICSVSMPFTPTVIKMIGARTIARHILFQTTWPFIQNKKEITVKDKESVPLKETCQSNKRTWWKSSRKIWHFSVLLFAKMEI